MRYQGVTAAALLLLEPVLLSRPLVWRYPLPPCKFCCKQQISSPVGIPILKRFGNIQLYNTVKKRSVRNGRHTVNLGASPPPPLHHRLYV